MHGTKNRSIASGIALGAFGAFAGCITGCYIRERLNYHLSKFTVGFPEDAFALRASLTPALAVPGE